MQVEDMSETAQRCLQHSQRTLGEEKSEPTAVTTQEAVDGYREKAIRIASVEQIELGNIMELSIGSGTQMGKTSEPLWRSVVAQS